MEWAAEAEPAELLREASTLAYLQRWAVENGRPTAALQLGQLIESQLALNGRWGLWQQSLTISQEASQLLADRPAEAWALNQMGCRALCLGHTKVAQTHLERAQFLNESVGNTPGTAINAHNLGLLGIATKASPWPRRLAYLFVGIVIVALLGWALRGQQNGTPISTPTNTATAVSPAATDTPVPTDVAPTHTAVPTERASDTPATVDDPTAIPTETSSPTTEPANETTIPTTETTVPTETVATTATINATNTPAPTATSRPTQTPIVTPFPTETAVRPNPISPERASLQRTNVTFSWQGSLQFGQRYQLFVTHTESGLTMVSGLLTDNVWTAVLPAEFFGEWQWQVRVMRGSTTLESSSNWHFYLIHFWLHWPPVYKRFRSSWHEQCTPPPPSANMS